MFHMSRKGQRREDLLRDQRPPEEVELPGFHGEEVELPRASTGVDPATQKLMQAGQQRVKNRRKTVAQKRKEIYDRQRQRASYDIPKSVREALKELADHLDCSASDLVTLALTEWLNSVDISRLEARRVETPPQNFRFRYTFEFPPLEVRRTAAVEASLADLRRYLQEPS